MVAAMVAATTAKQQKLRAKNRLVIQLCRRDKFVSPAANSKHFSPHPKMASSHSSIGVSPALRASRYV
jgi:hypothetical protein